MVFCVFTHRLNNILTHYEWEVGTATNQVLHHLHDSPGTFSIPHYYFSFVPAFCSQATRIRHLTSKWHQSDVKLRSFDVKVMNPFCLGWCQRKTIVFSVMVIVWMAFCRLPDVPTYTEDNPLLRSDTFQEFSSLTLRKCYDGVVRRALDFESGFWRLEKDIKGKHTYTFSFKPLKTCKPLIIKKDLDLSSS